MFINTIVLDCKNYILKVLKRFRIYFNYEQLTWLYIVFNLVKLKIIHQMNILWEKKHLLDVWLRKHLLYKYWMHTDMATCMLKIRQFLTQTTEMDFKTLAFINRFIYEILFQRWIEKGWRWKLLEDFHMFWKIKQNGKYN